MNTLLLSTVVALVVPCVSTAAPADGPDTPAPAPSADSMQNSADDIEERIRPYLEDMQRLIPMLDEATALLTSIRSYEDAEAAAAQLGKLLLRIQRETRRARPLRRLPPELIERLKPTADACYSKLLDMKDAEARLVGYGAFGSEKMRRALRRLGTPMPRAVLSETAKRYVPVCRRMIPATVELIDLLAGLSQGDSLQLSLPRMRALLEERRQMFAEAKVYGLPELSPDEKEQLMLECPWMQKFDTAVETVRRRDYFDSDELRRLLESEDLFAPTSEEAADDALLKRTALHNSRDPRRADKIGALMEGTVTEEDYRQALAAFQRLRQRDAGAVSGLRGLLGELDGVLLPLLCRYALFPELRPQLERFLVDSAREGDCRELLMFGVLRAGILGRENRELAERLFAQLPFSAEAFEAQLREAAALAALPPGAEPLPQESMSNTLFPMSRSSCAREELLRACLDADAAGIAALLVSRGELTRELVAEVVAADAAARPEPEDAVRGRASDAEFFTSNFCYLWPSQSFLQQRRMRRGLSPAWAELTGDVSGAEPGAHR